METVCGKKNLSTLFRYVSFTVKTKPYYEKNVIFEGPINSSLLYKKPSLSRNSLRESTVQNWRGLSIRFEWLTRSVQNEGHAMERMTTGWSSSPYHHLSQRASDQLPKTLHEYVTSPSDDNEPAVKFRALYHFHNEGHNRAQTLKMGTRCGWGKELEIWQRHHFQQWRRPKIGSRLWWLNGSFVWWAGLKKEVVSWFSLFQSMPVGSVLEPVMAVIHQSDEHELEKGDCGVIIASLTPTITFI